LGCREIFVTGPEVYLTGVIVVALLLIISNRLRADLVAILVLLALSIGGIVSPTEALSGFSRSAVITIMGLFIITSALDRTGITRMMADALLRVGGNSESRLVFLFTINAALLSLFMNNIAAGAVLLPAAVNVARRSKVPASRLMMPLAFGTLLGGMATYFTTANIIVSTALRDQNLPALGVFDFTPTGGVVALSGIVFMVLIGRHLLPIRAPAGQYASPRRSASDLEKVYQLGERLWEAEILPGSPLAGKTLGATGLGERFGIAIVAIWHKHHANLAPRPNDELAIGDILVIAGREDRVNWLAAEGCKLGRSSNRFGMEAAGVSLIEMIVAPHSQAEGKTLKELNFRKKYGVTAVALWRDGRSNSTEVGNFQLQFGDALLMIGPPDRFSLLRSEPDFIVLEGDNSNVTAPERAPVAIAITAFVLVASAINLLPIAEAMLLGAVLLVLTGCLTMDDSYRAIEWRAIFLLAGMLPISTAMNQEHTGLAIHIGEILIRLFGPLGPLAVIGALYVVTMLLTQVMSGQVTAVVLAPIAISAALKMNISPQAAAVAVAIGCSTSFLTPIAHPVNVLMMGPGGYTFGDYFRVGWGLTLVCLIALLIALPIFWRV
jgi:di/tricarboxylate transporter